MDKARPIEKYTIKNQQKCHLICKLKELVVLFHWNDFISQIKMRNKKRSNFRDKEVEEIGESGSAEICQI
jgi:hypothetical protein